MFNPITGGGGRIGPPWGFSGLNAKRYELGGWKFGTFPEHSLRVFRTQIFKIFSPRGESRGAFRGACHDESFLCLGLSCDYSCRSIEMKLPGWYITVGSHKMYISDFSKSCPKVRSNFDLAHYKSMEKHIFAYNLWTDEPRRMKLTPSHSPGPSASFDMHFTYRDLIWPWPEVKCWPWPFEVNMGIFRFVSTRETQWT